MMGQLLKKVGRGIVNLAKYTDSSALSSTDLAQAVRDAKESSGRASASAASLTRSLADSDTDAALRGVLDSIRGR